MQTSKAISSLSLNILWLAKPYFGFPAAVQLTDIPVPVYWKGLFAVIWLFLQAEFSADFRFQVLCF